MLSVVTEETESPYNLILLEDIKGFEEEAISLYGDSSDVSNNVPFPCFRHFMGADDGSAFYEMMAEYCHKKIAEVEGMSSDVKEWTDEQCEFVDELISEQYDFFESSMNEDIEIVWKKYGLFFETDGVFLSDNKYVNSPLQEVW